MKYEFFVLFHPLSFILKVVPNTQSPMPTTYFSEKLRDLSQKVGISSFKALGCAAGVSERQILRLRRGGRADAGRCAAEVVISATNFPG
jgi:hypothetical protein